MAKKQITEVEAESGAEITEDAPLTPAAASPSYPVNDLGERIVPEYGVSMEEISRRNRGQTGPF